MVKIKYSLFSLGIIGVFLVLASQSFALPIGYSSRGNDLFKIDLDAASKTLVGPVGFDDVEALGFNPLTGQLFGIDDENSSSSFESLITIDALTGAGTLIGSLGFTASNPGFAISPSGIAYLSNDPNGTKDDAIYTVDLSNGVATKLGNTGVNGIDGLAFAGNTLYGVSGFSSSKGLYTLDITSGTSTSGKATSLFSNSDFSGQMGLASDGANLYAISSDSNVFAIDLSSPTPVVTQSHLFMGGGFEGLAIQASVTPTPEPGTLFLFGSGLAGLVGWRWKKQREIPASDCHS